MKLTAGNSNSTFVVRVKNNELVVLLIVRGMLLVRSGIQSYDRLTWALKVAPALLNARDDRQLARLP